MISPGTFRIPCSVYRMAGTIAYITVASTALKSPCWNTMSTGIRKTKRGVVCRVSSMGRRRADTRSLCEASTLSSPPSPKQTMTAAPQRYTVADEARRAASRW